MDPDVVRARFRSLWATDAEGKPMPPRAQDRIQSEFVRLKARDTSGEGVAVELKDENPATWVVHLFMFTLCDEGSRKWRRALAHDLRDHKRTHGTDGRVEVEIRFPPTYPDTAPDVFLRRPILKDGTGAVVSGAFVLPFLLKDGWNSHYSMSKVLQWVRNGLVLNKARVDMGTKNCYPRAAFEAALKRIRFRPGRSEMQSSLAFDDGHFHACSGSFGASLDLNVTPQFQAGNKVFMPERVLESIQKRAGNSDWLTHSFMVFEITNHMNIVNFCGVLEFKNPEEEEDMMVLPDWMHRGLFLTEGMDIRVRPVALPQLAFADVQPHESWARMTEETGLDPITFMQQGLSNYVTVAAGEDMVLTVNGCNVVVSIISTRPNVPVCALFAGFDSKISLVFRPPRDAPREGIGSVDTPRPGDPRAGAHGGHGSGAGGAGAGAGAGPGGAAGAGAGRGAVRGTGSARDESKGGNEQFVEMYDRAEVSRARQREIERRGIPLPGVDPLARDTIKLRISVLAGNRTVTVVGNPHTQCKDVYEFLRTSYPTHKGGGGGAPFTLHRRSLADASAVPDDTTTLAAAGLKRREALEQRIVTSTACAGCREVPPPDTWACPMCTLQNSIAKHICDVCGGVQPPLAAARPPPPDGLQSFVLAKKGGSAGHFEVEVVGLCAEHTPQWLKTMQTNGMLTDIDMHLVTKEMVLSTAGDSELQLV